MVLVSIIALQKPFHLSDRESTPILFYLALDRTITVTIQEQYLETSHIQLELCTVDIHTGPTTQTLISSSF